MCHYEYVRTVLTDSENATRFQLTGRAGGSIIPTINSTIHPWGHRSTLEYLSEPTQLCYLVMNNFHLAIESDSLTRAAGPVHGTGE
jgi:hypothetical protein